MEKEMLNGMLAAQIHCADNGIQREFNRKLSKESLTVQQAMVLAFLAIAEKENEKVNQRKIQEFLQISNPSVVSLAKSLEKKGLATKGTEDCDGRNCLLLLTDEGREKADTIMPMLEETDRSIASLLTVKELATVRKVMHKLISAFYE